MLGRKGMSPLIVTILLIALAVALGAMIMNWSADAVVSAPGGSCDDVRLEPQSAFGSELICFDQEEGEINIVVKNSGRATLNSITYRRVTQNMRVSDIEMPDSMLRPGDIYEGFIGYQQSDSIYLELIPEIIIDGTPTLCPDKALVREGIRNC